jgi:hypothetical protein
MLSSKCARCSIYNTVHVLLRVLDFQSAHNDIALCVVLRGHTQSTIGP